MDILKKYELFSNLKKYHFYKNKAYFLGYIVLAYSIKIENEKIRIVKNWPKPKLIKDI